MAGRVRMERKAVGLGGLGAEWTQGQVPAEGTSTHKSSDNTERQ